MIRKQLFALTMYLKYGTVQYSTVFTPSEADLPLLTEDRAG